MQNQYIQHGSANPSVNIKFIVPSTGLSANGLTHTTPGLTITYSRPGAANVNITLAAQTITGAYAAGGFCLRGDGVYRLDLPTAAVLTGTISLSLFATALPADIAMVSTIIELGPDDMAQPSPTAPGISTQVMGDLAGAPGASARTAIGASVDSAVADNFAAIPGAVRTNLATELGRIDVAVSTGVGPTAATVSSQVMTDLAGAGGAAARTAIGVAVDGALADNFNAIPDIADIITALRAENTSSAWGVSSTPGGGSSIIYTDRRGGVTLGTRTAFFDSTGKMVGLSAVA